LSLANCAALLETQGHKVTILDAHADRIAPEEIGRFIKGYDKVFITSSALDKWQCPNIDIAPFLHTLRKIKDATDEVYALGYHGTVQPQKLLGLSKAKAVVRGEPEYTVLEICRERNLLDIKGLTFEYNGKIFSTPDREPLELESLPVPAFHALNFRKYFYEILGNNFALFEITRGCKFQCSFCNKVMYGEKLRSKSQEQIIEEITLALEKYGVKSGYFIDLDFLANKLIAEKLCKFLIEKRYKFQWTCQTRPESLDLETIREMKSAGCKIIHLGVETAAQELLDGINKKITIEQIERVLRLCKKVGMKAFVFILFGLPGETQKNREETITFIKKLNPEFVSFHKVVAYAESRIDRDKNDLPGDADRFIRTAFLKYYLRPSYIYNLKPGVMLSCLKLFYNRIKTL
jgi:radical SAM superfamily enzyme YgiQ (UPF0313 family)